MINTMVLRKYNLIVFDADKTLFDFDAAEAFALERLFQNRGLLFNKDVEALYQEENTRLWELFERGGVSKEILQVRRFEVLFERLELKGLDPVGVNDEYVVLLGEGSQLFDGAFEVCRELAKTKTLAIATNGVEKTQRMRFEKSSIKPFVDFLAISEVAGFAKPDGRYFDYLFALCGHADKSDVLLVGDSLSADIKGGNDYGLDTCWYNPQGQTNKTGIVPTYEIKRLKELIETA